MLINFILLIFDGYNLILADLILFVQSGGDNLHLLSFFLSEVMFIWKCGTMYYNNLCRFSLSLSLSHPHPHTPTPTHTHTHMHIVHVTLVISTWFGHMCKKIIILNLGQLHWFSFNFYSQRTGMRRRMVNGNLQPFQIQSTKDPGSQRFLIQTIIILFFVYHSLPILLYTNCASLYCCV